MRLPPSVSTIAWWHAASGAWQSGCLLLQNNVLSVHVMRLQIAVRAAAAERREKKPLSKQIEEDLQHEDTELSLPEVNSLLTCLWQKKEAMEKQESQVKMQLLLQFLHHAR